MSDNQCLKPCGECPYRKNSAPGYFGGHDPSEYHEALKEEQIVACHKRTRFKEDGSIDKLTACTGHIVGQIKGCKSPNGSNLALVDMHEKVRSCSELDSWKDNSLTYFDFKNHHDME